LIRETTYKLPKPKKNYAGIVLTLSKFEYPDLSSFSDEEVCFKVPLEYHAGLIVNSDKHEKVLELLDNYADRLVRDFAVVGKQESVKNLH